MKRQINQKKSIKQRKELNSSIKSSFTSEALTNYSGISSIYKFIKKLNILQEFDSIGIPIGSNRKYETSQIYMLIIFGLLCSANRLNKMEVFSQDALVQELLGLSGSIDAETISNRIKRNNLGTNSILIDIIGKLSNKIHSKISNTNDILDLDSTVRTVYGHQEGSCKGFNSHKRGAKSYHPLLGFLQSTKECLCSWFRSGDAYTSNNCVAFLEQTFRHISSGIRELLVRADSGFFDGKILTSIESRANTDYIIKVKMKGLRRNRV